MIAAPFYLSIMVLQGAFRGYQDTRTPFQIMILANIVNLVLCPLLALVLKMGVVGAGLATAASHLTASLGLLVLLFKNNMLRVADLWRVRPFQGSLSLARTGAILSVRTFSILSTVSLATTTAARMGTKELAAFEITRQIWALFARMFDATSVTAQSLIPLHLGRGKYTTARAITNRLLSLSFAVGILFAIILVGAARPLAQLFSRDPVVVALVASCFPVMGLCEPVKGNVFVLDGCFTAGRQYVFLSGCILFACLGSAASLFLVRWASLPLPWVWVCLNLMMVLRGLILTQRYVHPKYSPIPVQDIPASSSDKQPPR
uniref:Polysaccharide biosynthesis protein C-terminal domain-containing protein n=1 Tax=Compsopogon caeruleus TaxID=31354 RepID=A0A7S1XGR8_9RHOD|mmetsp:Transcript_9999/g.20263  ORF Transcript_9999/g.20263 Transcript_9999/m.20263 type:complete len:318 (+) Transcript_9999:680-1633(+)